MKKALTIWVLICLSLVCARAETILLRTGARVRGEILFSNEEVVIIRDAEGTRYQYPRSEVEAIETDERLEVTGERLPESEAAMRDRGEEGTKKASILLELAGGAAVCPGVGTGGGFSADLLVGSHHIGDRHLFIGGGLGYHGLFLGSAKYSFLPIQAALRVPFTESRHAPVLGVALGYGVALSKQYVGGLYAGLDLGYRCQLNSRTALSVVFYTQFQQAKVDVEETIEETVYVHRVGRYFVTPGFKLALYF